MVYLWHETNRSILSRKYQQNLEFYILMGNLWSIGICQRTLELGALCPSQIRTGSHWAQGKYVKKLRCINITHHDWFSQWWSKEASAGMRAEVPLKYTKTSCHSDGVYFWQYSQKHARVPGSRLLCSSSCSSSYKDGNTSFVANTDISDVYHFVLYRDDQVFP